jgi:lambda family phage portal protein
MTSLGRLGSALADGLGGVLDRTIGIFSPGREAHRQQERARAEAFRRYAAAQDGLQTGAWGHHDGDVNKVIGDSAFRLRARVRQLVRDFPFFARVLDAAVNLNISTGIILQYLMSKPDGSVDNDLNLRVEEAWADFCERLDASGHLDFVEMARLAKRQEIEVGESFALTPIDEADPIAPVKVQLYEPDWLNSFGAACAAGNKLVQGIEIDDRTGRVIAYHLEDPEHWGKPRRVESRFAIHTFQVLRPGQLRGVSPLASAVLAANDIGEYIGAEVDGAKKAAAYLATAKSPNPAQFAKQRGKIDAQSGARVRTLAKGIIEILHSDEDFKLLDHNRPGGQFEPTVNFITRMIAMAAGLSYEIVSGDYRGITFGNFKGIRSDLLHHTRPGQRRFARQFCQVVFSRWLDAQATLGRLRLQNYWQQRSRYLRAAHWLYPGVEGVDLLREARGALSLLAGGLETPQGYLGRRGLDPRDTLKAIAEFQRMAKEEGVELDWGRQPLKTNPAALGAQENGDARA